MSDQILVCQNRTCRKQGSPEVLEAFQALNLPNIEITATGCLGHCGSGPMVVILPEEIWYTQVDPQDAITILQKIENTE